MYIDSHSHLSSKSLLGDIDSLLARARGVGIEAVINICTSEESLAEGIKLQKKYPWVYQTAAITPHDAHQEMESYFLKIKEAAEKKQLVAIGETGLDYYYFSEKKEVQKKWLKRHLELALEKKLPVVIHCRDAFTDFFKMIDEVYEGAPGVLHCFTGTKEEAKEVIARGWYLSLSGIVTFKKSLMLREVASEVPLGQLLIETDAPYLAPQAKRGKTNEPSFLPYTADCIAEAKGITIQEIAEATSRNARELFSLD